MANSGLTFDPQTGLCAPPTKDLRAHVAAEWKKAFAEDGAPELNVEPSTPAGQLVDALLAEIEAKNAEIAFLTKQFNPKSAEGRWQDALGQIYFLKRKLVESTIVTCQLTGLNGTNIPYGTLAKSATGQYLICNRSVTVGPPDFPDGRAETTFRAIQAGAVEIGAHEVRTLITSVPGLDSIDNRAAGAVGRALETRSEFETRRAESVAANAHGSLASIYGTIANLPGVLDVEVLENNGPLDVVKFGVIVPAHGITVCVYGGEDSEIAEAIYRKKDNGAATGGNTPVSYKAIEHHNATYHYNILRPEPVNFWIRVVLGAGGSGESGSALNKATLEALQAALYQDFLGLNAASGNTRVGLASTVYASRFYRPALGVYGVNNIQSIEIALSMDEPGPDDFFDVLDIGGGQEPTIAQNQILIVQA